MILYKFCSYSDAEKIVENNTLKFTSPINFNDPFDCDIDRITFEYNNNLDCRISEDINKLKTTYSPELIKEVVNDEGWADIYKKSQLDKIRRTSVCCFSLNYVNQLLWSHYADKHKGICIAFNNDILERFYQIPEEKITEGKVQYQTSEKANYLANKLDAIVTLFLSKGQDWSYEEEYRVLSLIPEGFYQFNADFINSIIFGLKVTDEQIVAFKNKAIALGMNNLKYKKAIRNNLALEFIDI